MQMITTLVYFFFLALLPNSDWRLGGGAVSVGRVETVRWVQPPSARACPPFFSSLASLPWAVSTFSLAAPRLVFSYRLHLLFLLVPAAPRLLHRLQRCCSQQQHHTGCSLGLVRQARRRLGSLHILLVPFCYTAYCRCERLKCCNRG